MANAVPSMLVTRKCGHITIAASRTVEGGYAINVYAGADRIDALCYTGADRNLYRARYAAIRDFARQGYTPEQIAARINGQSAAAVAEAEEVITSTLADLATTARRTLTDTVPAGTVRQVRPTMAGAQHTKLTPAGQRALNSHTNGVVYPGDGITRPTLNALARQGHGTLTYTGPRKRIASLTLNKRGLNAVTAVA